MTSQAGQMLSHYRLLEKVGEGGMGIVYRAYDTRLKRDVALKVLPTGSLSRPASRKRFHKEALALSRLNHPNIAVVHDFDTDHDIDFLVMELIPGSTLVDRLATGPLPEADVILHGIQLSEGLSAAHNEGVIHRDLKPGNVRVTPDGRIKILDFGLAKMLKPLSEMATTVSLSDLAGPVGTLPYMAPELLEGRNADTRSDLYSLGAVLYELATGRRPFVATEKHGLVEAILRAGPPHPSSLNRRVSPGLSSVILKAMDKDPERRYQSARELRVDLERLRSPAPFPGPAGRASLVRWSALAVIGVLVVAAVVAVLFVSGGRNEEFGVAALTALATGPEEDSGSRISPDGQWVSFISNRSGRESLWALKLGGGQPRPMIAESGWITSHVWSPDGDEIAFLNRQGERTSLRIVPAFGGPARKTVRLESTFKDGRLIRWTGPHLYIEAADPLELGAYLAIHSNDGLWRLDIDSEKLERLMAANADPGRRFDFDVCEDESRLVFTLSRASRTSFWTSDLRGESPEEVIPVENLRFQARWLGPRCDHLVYTSETSGQPDLWGVALADKSVRRITSTSTAKHVDDVSRDGSLLTFTEVQDSAHLWRMDPRTSTPRLWQLTADSLSDMWPTAAHGAANLVFLRSKPAPERADSPLSFQVFTADLETARVSRVRLLASDGTAARLSPDGRWLAYVKSPSPGVQHLWIHDLVSDEGWRAAESFRASRLWSFPMDWVDVNHAWGSGGGSLFFVAATRGGDEVRRLDIAGGNRRSEAIVPASGSSVFRDLHPSPDGRFVCYVRSPGPESRREELRVLDLRSGKDHSLFTRTTDPRGDFHVRGWSEQGDSLIVLVTVANPDWTQTIEVHEVRLSGKTRLLGEIGRGFGGTARLDAKARTLYLTKAEDDGPAHNLWAFLLDTGKLRRLTNNTIIGISFSGIELVSDGSLIYSQLVKNENIWLIRFNQDVPMTTGKETP